MKSEFLKKISLVIISFAFVGFVYTTYKAIMIVDKTQIGTSDGVYTSYVSTSKEIQNRAYVLTKECESKLCRIQKLLDFTTNIPYVTQTFQQKHPKQTIEDNFGDCDDKSNLLISMLHALEIEAYFVLVPKHIFVIVPLEDSSLNDKKGLWINGKKYYILESTAIDSNIGFPLSYELDKVETIIEPFGNRKIDIQNIEYK